LHFPFSVFASGWRSPEADCRQTAPVCLSQIQDRQVETQAGAGLGPFWWAWATWCWRGRALRRQTYLSMRTAAHLCHSPIRRLTGSFHSRISSCHQTMPDNSGRASVSAGLSQRNMSASYRLRLLPASDGIECGRMGFLLNNVDNMNGVDMDTLFSYAQHLLRTRCGIGRAPNNGRSAFAAGAPYARARKGRCAWRGGRRTPFMWLPPGRVASFATIPPHLGHGNM